MHNTRALNDYTANRADYDPTKPFVEPKKVPMQIGITHATTIKKSNYIYAPNNKLKK